MLNKYESVKIIHIIQYKKNILFVFYLFSGVTDVQECGGPERLIMTLI